MNQIIKVVYQTNQIQLEVQGDHKCWDIILILIQQGLIANEYSQNKFLNLLNKNIDQKLTFNTEIKDIKIGKQAVKTIQIQTTDPKHPIIINFQGKSYKRGIGKQLTIKSLCQQMEFQLFQNQQYTLEIYIQNNKISPTKNIQQLLEKHGANIIFEMKKVKKTQELNPEKSQRYQQYNDDKNKQKLVQSKIKSIKPPENSNIDPQDQKSQRQTSTCPCLIM